MDPCVAIGRQSRKTAGKTMRRLMLCGVLLSGCAAIRPDHVWGQGMTQWEKNKRQRLLGCQHKPLVETERQGRACMGGYKTYRGTRACTDTQAWFARLK